MVNCSKKSRISLNDIRNFEVSRKLFENVAAWLQQKPQDELEFLGTKEQILIVKEAIIASKRFQDELTNPDSTLLTVEAALHKKHQSAEKFKNVFNLVWPL